MHTRARTLAPRRRRCVAANARRCCYLPGLGHTLIAARLINVAVCITPLSRKAAAQPLSCRVEQGPRPDRQDRDCLLPQGDSSPAYPTPYLLQCQSSPLILYASVSRVVARLGQRGMSARRRVADLRRYAVL